MEIALRDLHITAGRFPDPDAKQAPRARYRSDGAVVRTHKKNRGRVTHKDQKFQVITSCV